MSHRKNEPNNYVGMKLFSLLDYQLKITWWFAGGWFGNPAIMRMKGSFPETSTSSSQNLAHLMDKVIQLTFSVFKTTGFSDVSTGGLPLRVLGVGGWAGCFFYLRKWLDPLKANQLQSALGVVSLRGPDKFNRKNKPEKKDGCQFMIVKRYRYWWWFRNQHFFVACQVLGQNFHQQHLMTSLGFFPLTENPFLESANWVNRPLLVESTLTLSRDTRNVQKEVWPNLRSLY